MRDPENSQTIPVTAALMQDGVHEKTKRMSVGTMVFSDAQRFVPLCVDTMVAEACRYMNHSVCFELLVNCWAAMVNS